MSSGIANGAVGQIPPTSPVIASAAVSNGNAVTLYTVPTGRTFYCTGFAISCNNIGWVQVLVNAAQVLYFDMAADSNTGGNGNPIFAATSGQAVTIDNTGGSDHTVSIWGYNL